jgi:hypothetical protein
MIYEKMINKNINNFAKWIEDSSKQYKSYGNKIILQEKELIQKRNYMYPNHTLSSYIESQKNNVVENL